MYQRKQIQIQIQNKYLCILKTNEKLCSNQETPHVYTFKTFRHFPPNLRHSLPTDGIVTMQQAIGSEDVNLPSPVFLDCHHRIAEVLNASGMGEVIEKLIREWEDIKIYESHGSLDPLGGSDVSRILETALWQRVCG